jgi:predicted CXXCH cytochrome family protein
MPREGCQECHTGQGALQAWGISSSYKEDSDALADHQAIVCAVCHDPHSPEHPGQLRFPIDAPNQQQNLCMKCHHKRAIPEMDVAAFRGPHSPEGPLLLGEAGWWPPGFNTTIQTTHGPQGNPRMCATCHVLSTELTDPDAVLTKSTGHLFAAIPCVDSTGVPNTEDCEVEVRTFEACVACHQTEPLAMQAFNRAVSRTTGQVRELDSLLALVPPGELNMNSGIFTVAKGAWFNARLAEKKGSSTHNGFLIDELLKSSIAVVKNQYGLASVEMSELRDAHNTRFPLHRRRFLSESD